MKKTTIEVGNLVQVIGTKDCKGTVTFIADNTALVTLENSKEELTFTLDELEIVKVKQPKKSPAEKLEEAKIKAEKANEAAKKIEDELAEKTRLAAEKEAAIKAALEVSAKVEADKAENAAKLEPLLIEQGRKIVNNELSISGFTKNRAVFIKEMLDLLKYDETASKKVCIEIQKQCVDFIQRSFKEMLPDVVFDQTNLEYCAVKKQIDIQTKIGRLGLLEQKDPKTNTTGIGKTGTRTNKEKEPALIDGGDSNVEKSVVIKHEAFKVVPDPENYKDLTFFSGSSEKNVKETTMFDFVKLNDTEIIAIIQADANLLTLFMDTLRMNQKTA